MVPSYGSQRLRGAWTKKKDNMEGVHIELGLKDDLFLFLCAHMNAGAHGSQKRTSDLPEPGAGCCELPGEGAGNHT